jgi:Ca2+-binding RTX toxin-like protein
MEVTMKKQARLTKKAKKALRVAVFLAATAPVPLWAQSALENPAADSYKFGSQIAATQQVLYFDTFDLGERPEWQNELGDWIANGGVYYPTSGSGQILRSTITGFALKDFVVDVDINHVVNGGVWLRYSGSDSPSGVLLVARGGPESDVYWHLVKDGNFSDVFNRVVWDRGDKNVHLRITVQGNDYKVFVDGSATPLTTLTTSDFAFGTAGLFDNSLPSDLSTVGVQNFDNFQVTTIPTCAGLSATIIGTDGDNIMSGTAGPDVIVGLGGNDVIYGLGNNDVICGGSGDDRISGGTGNDRLYGQTGNNVLQGDSGNDILVGGASNDIVNGATGNDILLGDAGNDTLNGGSENDTLIGGLGLDVCDGNIGVDLAATCELVTNLP